MGLSNVYGVTGVPSIHHEAAILDGREAATAWRAKVADTIARTTATGMPTPVLASISVGDDSVAAIDVAAIHGACADVGIELQRHAFPWGVSEAEVASCIHDLSSDDSVAGILLQPPLPDHLDSGLLIERIDPVKDVDGLTATNQGRLAGGTPGVTPCTPSGVLALLDHFDIDVDGRRATVVGRSKLVGAPMATLLIQRNATVTVCHSRSRDLAHVTSSAEILIVAAGVPELIGRDHVGPGSVVIDVGIHRMESGLTGDVDHGAIQDRVRALSPVPGGVGPMTVTALLDNTTKAALAIAAGA